MRKIAIYGKGGIGKSTTTQNTVAGLAEMGRKVMVVGCNPKADSTRLFLGGLAQKSVLDTLREEGEDVELDDIRRSGFSGTVCVESGGPEPGVGCAGRGIITSINLLNSSVPMTRVKSSITPSTMSSVTSSAAGFAMPIREGKAGDLYRCLRRNDGHVCCQQHLQRYREVRRSGQRATWRSHLQLPKCRFRKGDDRGPGGQDGHPDDLLRSPRQHRTASGNRSQNGHRMESRPISGR